MDIRVLYDRWAEPGFKTGYGFSCLVGDRLLFDAGYDKKTLLFNMRRAGVDLDKIDKVFISHDHGNHAGGVDILSVLGDVRVFIPKSSPRILKRRLASHENATVVEVRKAGEISEGLYTTGQLGRLVKEQSLVVETDRGVTVVVGCCHPGVVRIMKAASSFGEIYGMVGGFHGFRRLEELSEVSLIAPCHCTLMKHVMMAIYPETCVRCSAGRRFEV